MKTGYRYLAYTEVCNRIRQIQADNCPDAPGFLGSRPNPEKWGLDAQPYSHGCALTRVSLCGFEGMRVGGRETCVIENGKTGWLIAYRRFCRIYNLKELSTMHYFFLSLGLLFCVSKCQRLTSFNCRTPILLFSSIYVPYLVCCQM